MLSVYDLYDIYAVFILIRQFPNYKKHINVLKKLIEIIKCKSADQNIIRKTIRQIPEIDYSIYKFASVDNYYTYYPSLLKDEKIYFLLNEVLNYMINVLSENNIKKIEEIADCVHNLPIMLADNKFTVPKEFWSGEVQYFRSKWDKNFLVNCQAILK